MEKEYKPSANTWDICPNCGYNSDNQTKCCLDVASLKSRAELYEETLKRIAGLECYCRGASDCCSGYIKSNIIEPALTKTEREK